MEIGVPTFEKIRIVGIEFKGLLGYNEPSSEYVMDLILLCLLIATYLDAILLKQRDRLLYRKVFAVSPLKTIAGFVLILIILITSDDKAADFPPLILLFVLSLYFLRRDRFTRAIKQYGRTSLSLLSNAVGVIIIWMYGVLVFGFILSVLTDFLAGAISEMGSLILSAAFSIVLIMILVYRSSQNFSDRGFLTNVGLRKGNRSSLKVFFIPIILGLFFALFSSYLISMRLVQPQTPLTEILDTTRSVNLILVFLFLAICIAPLIEEIVFRGYFFHVIKEWIGAKKTIYVIALTFAFLHVGQYWGDWMAIAMVTLLGFTLTILRAWSGSTVASVITHYIYNGGVTIIPIIMIAMSNPPYFQYTVYYPYHDAQTKEALLKESIANDPDLVTAYNDLAWLYVEENKNLNIALELVEKSLSYAPEQSAYLDTKAAILEKLGRMDEAISLRKRLDGELP